MLPNHHDLARAMANRTNVEVERAARDREFRRDLQRRAPLITPPARPNGHPDTDRSPCPQPCPDLAGAAG